MADRYFVHEDSIRTAFGDVLSLIWWKDERMLIAIDEDEERQDERRADDHFRR
jgi:hypothetical protein